jgi:hypothetical protein
VTLELKLPRIAHAGHACGYSWLLCLRRDLMLRRDEPPVAAMTAFGKVERLDGLLDRNRCDTPDL